MKSLQRRLHRSIGPWVFAAALLGFGSAMAQSEPTLAQVYEAAQAGQMDKAQTMMQQVLVAHPSSAKAHFVQAELSARQGNLSRAQEELQTAEKLAPGLPFAKPEALQHLRSQIAAKTSTTASNSLTNSSNVVTKAAPAVPPVPASSFPWGMALGLGAAGIALYFVLNRKKAVATPQTPIYGASNGLSGPQNFGMGNAAPAAPYGQQPYGQPPVAGSGMGSKIAGGLATGLAVGAGMMAANAIGKTLMGGDEHSGQHTNNGNGNNFGGFEPSPQNTDMGGQNFGVQDAGGWDDAGGGVDAGGDWDN